MLKSNLCTDYVPIKFCTMRHARGIRVLYEGKHDWARGSSTEKGDAFGEVITVYVRLGGDERHRVDI